MSNIKDLIEFIKNNPPKDKYFFNTDCWERALAESIPNWISIVKNKRNWSKIENVRPLGDYYYLCTLFVNTVGLELAKRWFKSEEYYQRKAARNWFKDIENLSSEIWLDLENPIKEYIIKTHLMKYFQRNTDYSHDRLRFLFLRERHFTPPKTMEDFINLLEELVNLLRISGGFQSDIHILRFIISEANDRKYLELIDNALRTHKKFRIDLFKELSSFMEMRPFLHPKQIPYNLTKSERELVSLTVEKFYIHGYSITPLPEIYLSRETPPLFIVFPELEEEQERQRELKRERKWMEEEEKDYIRRRRERVRGPEHITIEEVLGYYSCNPHPKIVLFSRGIEWCAKRYNFDEKTLRAVVIVHEIGHWITHLLPKADAPSWPTEHFFLTSSDVLEGWAQLITWWIADEINGEFKRSFEELNRYQSSPYRVFERFKKLPISRVVNSLERLRQLNRPADLTDWDKLLLTGWP